MKCQKVRESLQDYLNDKLSVEFKKAIEQHLKECQDCTAELGFLQVYFNKANNAMITEAPSDLLANIHRRLEETNAPKRFFAGFFTPLTAGLAGTIGVVAVLILVFFLYNPLTSIPEKEPNIDKAVGTYDQAALFKESKPIATVASVGKTKNNRTIQPEILITLAVSYGENYQYSEHELLRKSVPVKKSENSKVLTESLEENQPQLNSTKNSIVKDEMAAKTVPQSEEEETQLEIWQIKNLILQLQGNILEEKYNQTGKPEEFLFQVPELKYQQLLSELSKYGTFIKPEINKHFSEKITIKLKFCYKPADE